MELKLYDEVKVVRSLDPEGDVTIGHTGTIVDIYTITGEYLVVFDYDEEWAKKPWRCVLEELELVSGTGN